LNINSLISIIVTLIVLTPISGRCNTTDKISSYTLLLSSENEHKIAYSSKELYQNIVEPFLKVLKDNGTPIVMQPISQTNISMHVQPSDKNYSIDVSLELKINNHCKSVNGKLTTDIFQLSALNKFPTTISKLTKQLLISNKESDCKNYKMQVVINDENNLLDMSRDLKNKGHLLISYSLLSLHLQNSIIKDATIKKLVVEELEYLLPLFELDYKSIVQGQQRPDRLTTLALIRLKERLARSLTHNDNFASDKIAHVQKKLDEIRVFKLLLFARLRGSFVPYIQQTLFSQIVNHMNFNSEPIDKKVIENVLNQGSEPFVVLEYAQNGLNLEMLIKHKTLGYQYRIDTTGTLVSVDFVDEIENLL